MMRLGEGKGMWSRRIEGRGQVLNIAPDRNGTTEVSQPQGSREVLGSSRTFGSLQRGETLESGQKEDLFSLETILRCQHNCFVKYQNDSLDAFVIISVVSLVKNKHTR